jgi:hypothetical protein
VSSRQFLGITAVTSLVAQEKKDLTYNAMEPDGFTKSWRGTPFSSTNLLHMGFRYVEADLYLDSRGKTSRKQFVAFIWGAATFFSGRAAFIRAGGITVLPWLATFPMQTMPVELRRKLDINMPMKEIHLLTICFHKTYYPKFLRPPPIKSTTPHSPRSHSFVLQPKTSDYR